MVGTLGILNFELSESSPEYAATLAFTTFVLFQIFNVFNARAEFESAFATNFFKNVRLWFSLALVLMLQALAVEWEPAQETFSTTSLSGQDWLLAAGVASSVLILDEIYKLMVRLVRKDDS